MITVCFFIVVFSAAVFLLGLVFMDLFSRFYEDAKPVFRRKFCDALLKKDHMIAVPETARRMAPKDVAVMMQILDPPTGGNANEILRT